ncbi:thiolase family protein [Metallumcola ferriviriculae]|uniref:Acetyl-CoA acetyltransferase n=1 Tax=Metallumcola ferriviriculae TaxID=3039180 RepID=A0AAU0UND1_9FIRM|nr:thiolase family protein [Desulfitibacteraceae bacterium MK1]
MRNVVIVAAKRTPIGDFLGSLKSVSAVDLGTTVTKAALQQANLKPDVIQDVVAGMVYKEGVKGNPARQVQINCGIPVESAAATIDQQCGSSMRAFEIISQQIMLNKIDTGLVVGIESMSNVPYLLLNARGGYRMGPGKLEDGLLYDALVDAFEGYHVGITAENLAEQYNISREEQDELALSSHARALKAIEEGKFANEIVPVEVKTKKGTVIFDTDEHPRKDISMEKLAKLPPAFKKGGTVTAGNASGINDGASAIILMAEETAKERGIKPLARLVATASYGVEPKVMGIGPAYAIPKVLKFAGMSMSDIDYFEINEAFAAQVLACNRELKINMDRLNVNGSGVALGHPVGATGIRLIASLIYEMQRRQDRHGIASLCVGGGPAMATLVELL